MLPGYGPLPWAVMAEVFPTNVKALASAITASFCWFIAFLLTKFFNNVVELLGTYFPFFLFCGLCVITAIFTIFVVPDTRGMTMQEILDLLNKRPATTSHSGTTSDETRGA
uniref:Major facilitator superfamily (MFS) profile domain-containing protein n=1 Tax=Homalodisca liturata TaxID=320908 RepID=A0A1B6IV33_9HEMI